MLETKAALLVASLASLLIALLFARHNCEAKVSPSERQLSIRMPDIRPDHSEQYLCVTRSIKRNKLEQEAETSEFIVGFKPQSDAHRVHHMLLYGCQLPGIYQRDSPNFVWDCSSMYARPTYSSDDDQFGELQQPASSFELGPVCRGRQQILYGWAMGAPALKLPDGVGFKVGADTGIDFVVLQVHYGQHGAFERLPELTDNSGLMLELRAEAKSAGGPPIKRAGVLLLSSSGQVKVGRSRHEIWCTIDDPIEVHPFRFRVHTHKFGVRVFAAKIGNNNNEGRQSLFDGDQARLIGSGDPQKPQMFYELDRDNANVSLKQGDQIYAACEFNNNQSSAVQIGSTAADEMCNFYLMYWTDGAELLRTPNCVSENPLI